MKDLTKIKVSEFVDAMIQGLENSLNGKYQNTKLDMQDFGYAYGSLCVGCAALHCLMNLNDDKEFPIDIVGDRDLRANFLGADSDSVYTSENAIDQLREGDFALFFAYLSNFNQNAKLLFEDKEIYEKARNIKLTTLDALTDSSQLDCFRQLSTFLKQNGY